MKYIIYDFSKSSNFYLTDKGNYLFSLRVEDAEKFNSKKKAEDAKKLLIKFRGGEFKVLEVYS